MSKSKPVKKINDGISAPNGYGSPLDPTGVLILRTPPYVNTDRPKILRFFVNVNTDPGKLARRRREKFELFLHINGETVKKWFTIGYFWGPQILRIFVNVNTDSQTIGWILKKKR